MSVAFRRESDEEHKEPRFEIPIPPGPNLVTARGLAEISARRAAIEAAIPEAASDEDRETLKREARYWQTRQTSAHVAPIPGGEDVAFGTRVTLCMGGKTRTIDLVGSDEADPLTGRIAFTAPLAAAIMGATVGDECDFNGKEGAIEITAIQVIPDEAA